MSVITTISILGVAVGVMALSVVLSVVSGFEADFEKKILGNNSPLILFKMGGAMRDYKQLIPDIESVSGVKVASPFLYGEVLIHSESGRSAGIVVYGVDPEKVGLVTTLGEDMREGKLSDLSSSEGLPKIVLGKKLLEDQLYVFTEQNISLVSPTGELTPYGFGPKIRQFEVSGVFQSGMYEYDSKSGYISLSSAQSFFNREGEVSGIQIQVDRLDRARVVARDIQSKVGSSYYVRHWMELNEDLFKAFKLEKTTFFVVLTMIVLVASFNILGTLTLMVITRSKEIAVLRTMGASRKSIAKIFMFSGTAIGMIGTIIGLALGVVMCVLLRDVIQFPLNADVYQISTLPVKMQWHEFAFIGLCALLISFISTLYPALQASGLDPSEGIRYE
ncbi:MAG: FtsX-like permease family protein [Bdellovibrionales bacterium]|nr:FtsX-like permease family protein [Bdellovibrionales bacterium]